MAAPVRSLLTTDEAKAAIKLQSVDASVVGRLELMLGWVADLVDQIGETQFVEVDSTAILEIHDLAAPSGFLQLRRRPVIDPGSVVLETGDPATVVDAASYYVDEARGLVMFKGGTANARPNRRPPSMFAGNPAWVDFPEDYFSRYGGSFSAIPNAARVTYRGGFENTGRVPGDLKRAASNILARWWREEERKSQGLASEVAQGFSFAQKFVSDLVSGEDRRTILARGNLSRTARPLPPRPEIETGTLQGTVVDGGAIPVVGATVYACPSGLSATTIAGGAYTIPDVPVGDIVVKAAKTAVGFGIEAAEMTVGGTIVVALTLSLPYASPECA